MCGGIGGAAVVGCGGESMGCCAVFAVITGADDGSAVGGAVVGGPAVGGSCGGGFGHQRVTGTPCQRIGST